MTSKHQAGVTSYLNKHKRVQDKVKEHVNETKSVPQAVQKRQICQIPQQSHKSRTAVPMATKQRMLQRKQPPLIKGKANINHLPDEIMLELFEYLDASSLLTAASVCKRWLGLANDNVMWIKVYQTYAKPGRNMKTPEGKLPVSFWKDLCLKQCSEEKNKNVMKQMKKLNPFTGLPKFTEQTMKKNGIYFHLSMLDNRSVETVNKSSGIFYHNMSVCIRWYNLQSVPLNSIRKIRVLACNPLFFNGNGTVISNSPYQRSLMTELDIKWEVWKKENKPVKEDENIKLYKISSDILIATWKADEELAFIVAGYHQNHLVRRCLFGSGKTKYKTPEHKVIADDIDPSYGLHHYNCTVELRNMRQFIWSQQFQGVECKKDNIVNNICSFVVMRRESVIDRVTVSKEISLPWKTDLFKGVVKDVCWLDITMLDERNEVFWTACSPVYTSVKETVKSVAMDFDYRNESKLEMNYKEDNVEVLMEINEMDDGKRFITHLEIKMDVKLIDEWFGTQYSPPEKDDKKKVQPK